MSSVEPACSATVVNACLQGPAMKTKSQTVRHALWAVAVLSACSSADPRSADNLERDHDPTTERDAGEEGAPKPEPAPGSSTDAGRSGGPEGSTDARVSVGDPDAGGGSTGAFEGEGTPWVKTVPKAICGAQDKPETLQGVPKGNKAGYSCNLKVAGNTEIPVWMALAWYKQCAYVNGNDGTTVLDVSDPAHPKTTAMLATPGMKNAHESMKVHQERALLVAYASGGTAVDIYDLSKDCTKPVLAATIEIPGGNGHSGNFNADGTIYYASPNPGGSALAAVDLTDPKKPKIIATKFPDNLTHDLSTNKDGTRGYFMQLAPPGGLPTGALTGGGGSGLSIVDLTEVQARKPSAKVSVISETSWLDGNTGQASQPITYHGKEFLLVTDELGNRGLIGLGSCGANPTFSFPRIFDISDEKHPKEISRLMLEAEDPKHCAEAVAAGPILFGFGSHYCSVDRNDDPRLAVCSFWESGIRVFDIRNPWQPKEIAYFNPADGDMAPALSRILPEKRQIWVALMFSGFYVLDFTNSVVDQILSETH
jgi:hypothetical protein